MCDTITQFWIGSTDLISMLTSIGGWHVNCENHRQAIEAVAYADQHGYLTRRIHYAPMIPEGVEAFELTDKGIEALRNWDDKAANFAVKQRQWYRDRSHLRF